MGLTPQASLSLHCPTAESSYGAPTGCPLWYPEPGLISLSPQGLQSSYPEEYLRTLLCLKKLGSR